MGLAPHIAAGFGEFFASLPSWLGSLPAWITAIGFSTYLTLWVKRELGLKKLSIEADSVKIEAKKVENADEADIRDHYAQEVQALREALNAQSTRHQKAQSEQELRHQTAMAAQDKRHNDALTALEDRHRKAEEAMSKRQEDCEKERETLRNKLSDMEEEMAGVRTQIRMNSADQVVLLADSGEPVPPHALAAAKRIVERHS